MTQGLSFAPPASADSGARPDPYQHIAAFYDAEHGRSITDAVGYARRGVPGPLLVLGCGTGRIPAFLETVRPVTGLDASTAMLERARARARGGGGGARYVEGDMRRFDLGRFAEVVVPNGAFAFLPTRADQAACLAAVHRALPPGGPLTLDLPMPDFSMLGQPHTPARPAWTGAVDGVPALRTRETWRYPVEGRLHFLDRYHLEGETVAESHLHLRLAFPAEIEWMLETAGFYVDAFFGDHHDGPLREGCPRLLVRAIRL